MEEQGKAYDVIKTEIGLGGHLSIQIWDVIHMPALKTLYAQWTQKKLCHICIMLDQRLADVVQMLYKCFVFARW